MGREILTEDVLDCGCVVGTALVDEVPTMFITPCSETCSRYAFVITEGRKAGMPIDFKEEL